jgi:hypothetical protein
MRGIDGKPGLPGTEQFYDITPPVADIFLPLQISNVLPTF